MTIELSTLGAVIKAAYEAQADTNAFTDAEKQKLDEMEMPGAVQFADIQNVPSFVPQSQRGVANGFAPLDASNLVPLIHLNVGGLSFKGAWNPTTNVPTLIDGTGSVGDFYKASVAGSRNLGNGSFTYSVGDWVIYAGGTWQRIGVTDAVAMVNGKLGSVVLNAADVGALPSTYTPPVTSVAGKTGAVTLTAADVSARPVSYVPAWGDVTGKPDLAALYQPKQRGAIGPAIPALFGRRTSNFSVPNNVLTLLPWNALTYDQFAMADGGLTGVFTVPAWAKYARVKGSVQFFGNATGERQISVRVDGVNRSGAGITRQNVPGVNAFVLLFESAVIPVTAGEVISIAAWQSSGGALDVQSGNATWLQIELYEAMV